MQIRTGDLSGHLHLCLSSPFWLRLLCWWRWLYMGMRKGALQAERRGALSVLAVVWVAGMS